MDRASEEKEQREPNSREPLPVLFQAWNSNSSWADIPTQTGRCYQLCPSLFKLPASEEHPEQLKKVPSPGESTNLIVEGGICAFLHCCLLLLITNLDDHHRVNVLTHQLPGLDDGDGNLQGARTPCTLPGSPPAHPGISQAHKGCHPLLTW